MSLGPFPILLIPSTKNGKLQFWNDLTQQIIEADFSRPNIDDTSGVGVWRNGVFIELEEDEPDWDDSSGCPVIKMRPQAENLSTVPDQWINGTMCTLNAGVALDGTNTAIEITDDDVGAFKELQFRITDGSSTQPIGSSFVFAIPLKKDTDVSRFPEFVLRCYGGAGEDSIYIQLNTSTGASVMRVQSGGSSYEVLDYGSYWVVVVKSTLTIAQTRIRAYILPAATDVIGSRNVSATGSILVDQIFIATTSNFSGTIPYGVTRAANTFEFNDLINKGAITANGDFSVLINPYIYENAIYNTATIRFLSGSTQVFTLVMYPEGKLRVLDRINGGWITPNQNAGEGLKPIILAFNGATKILKVYFEEALQGTSPNLSLSIDRVEFNAPNDITYDLHDLNFSPKVLTDTEAIAELNSL
jgi:hypothetical protein